MLILNMFTYKSFYENKEKEKLQDIIVVQMYEIVKIQMHFQSIYLIFFFIFFNKCVDLGKFLINEIIYFHLDKVWYR